MKQGAVFASKLLQYMLLLKFLRCRFVFGISSLFSW